MSGPRLLLLDGVKCAGCGGLRPLTDPWVRSVAKRLGLSPSEFEYQVTRQLRTRLLCVTCGARGLVTRATFDFYDEDYYRLHPAERADADEQAELDEQAEIEWSVFELVGPDEQADLAERADLAEPSDPDEQAERDEQAELEWSVLEEPTEPDEQAYLEWVLEGLDEQDDQLADLEDEILSELDDYSESSFQSADGGWFYDDADDGEYDDTDDGE